MSNFNDSLVVLMNNKVDFEIAKQEGWYRIPVRHAPPIIKQQKLKFIAFYFTKAFGKEKYQIKWFAEVNNIQQVKRTDLFPNEAPNKKTKKQYYKISFSTPKVLYRPIVSIRPRRLLFVPTTSYKLFNALEFNDIFNSNLLEEKMWKAFLKHQIYVERQFRVDVNHYGSKSHHLDFAIFCKNKNIGIDCVSPREKSHFTDEEVAMLQKTRDALENIGWTMLYLTPDQIEDKLEDIFSKLEVKIAQNGGLKESERGFRYLQPDNNNQLDLELF
mgnify:CR=1 FL=1